MNLEKAFKKLLVKEPFYGIFALSLSKEENRCIPTMCVSPDGVGVKLKFNPDFWNSYPDDQQIALLKHELSHICLKHIFLQDSFPDKELFNISADIEVNSYIDNLPPDCQTAELYNLEKGKGTKYYYEQLRQQQQQQAQAQNPNKPCNGGKGGNSDNDNSQNNGSPSSDPNNSNNPNTTPNNSNAPSDPSAPTNTPHSKALDSHDSWKEFSQMSETKQQLIGNTIDNILKDTADQVEKSRGTIPSELQGLIEKLRKKKPQVFNWRQYFRRLLGTIYDIDIKSTRRRPSRRFDGSSGIKHKKKVSILVAIDTSGSVSVKELKEFLNEIDYIHKAGARVTILQCDAAIHSIKEYNPKDDIIITGRGGTDFNPPVNYFIKHKKDYVSLVFFTDGEAPLPRQKISSMIWIISSDGTMQDFPGKKIQIPKTA